MSLRMESVKSMESSLESVNDFRPKKMSPQSGRLGAFPFFSVCDLIGITTEPSLPASETRFMEGSIRKE